MMKTIVIDGDKLLSKFNEALVEFIEAEGEIPEKISIIAESSKQELGQVSIKKTVFEKLMTEGEIKNYRKQ